MSRILALILAASAPMLSAANPLAAETVPAVADYDGGHAMGMPVGLAAVAVAFVLSGAWLLWISSRSRA